jgi:hypothetical protein
MLIFFKFWLMNITYAYEDWIIESINAIVNDVKFSIID